MTQHHPQPPQYEPPASLSRRAFVLITASGAAAIAAAGGLIFWISSRIGLEDPAVGELRAAFVDGPLPDDPADAAWISRSPATVTLLPQNMTTPMLAEQTIQEIQLRVLHNASEIAFHLEWEDDDLNDLDAMGQFRDSVAVQLPVNGDRNTPITMGGPGMPFHILHWKASWQRQQEHGPRQVRDAFPHAVNEVTPEDVLGEEAARVVYPALYVGNPAAARDRGSAVEELVAEGFGTVTTHERQRAAGRGVLADGRWRVVIQMPMTGDDRQPTLRRGATTQVALAAWDGGHGNRGARKHWSNWVAMDVEANG
jgi:hypothetical protein